MASVFVLLEAFNRKEAAALGFFPCATASWCDREDSNLLHLASKNCDAQANSMIQRRKLCGVHNFRRWS